MKRSTSKENFKSSLMRASRNFTALANVRQTRNGRSPALGILYINMGFGVPSAHRLVFGTETGLLWYGILLLIKCFPGEFKDCRGKVAVAAGILVEVVLVVLLGFVETAEGL